MRMRPLTYNELGLKDNPFLEDMPLEGSLLGLFVNRENELMKLLSMMNSRGSWNACVYGLKGVGKTTLVNKALEGVTRKIVKIDLEKMQLNGKLIWIPLVETIIAEVLPIFKDQEKKIILQLIEQLRAIETKKGKIDETRWGSVKGLAVGVLSILRGDYKKKVEHARLQVEETKLSADPTKLIPTLELLIQDLEVRVKQKILLVIDGADTRREDETVLLQNVSWLMNNPSINTIYVLRTQPGELGELDIKTPIQASFYLSVPVFKNHIQLDNLINKRIDHYVLNQRKLAYETIEMDVRTFVYDYAGGNIRQILMLFRQGINNILAAKTTRLRKKYIIEILRDLISSNSYLNDLITKQVVLSLRTYGRITPGALTEVIETSHQTIQDRLIKLYAEGVVEHQKKLKGRGMEYYLTPRGACIAEVLGTRS